MAIPAERNNTYKRLAKLVGNTPLYEIKNIKIPNNCRIFCKEENMNPTGSHYDRFWVEFLKYYEENERTINLNIPIVETSTGNSGASFAWVCRALGFKNYHVVIPKDMPYSRRKQIESYGAKIHYSPENEYVGGLINEFQNYVHKLKKDLSSKNGHVKIQTPNHAKNGAHSIKSMENIAMEIIEELSNVHKIQKVDYFVSALGNGLTTKGM